MPFLATYTATGAPLEDFPWTYEAGQESPPLGITIENTGPGPASPVLIALLTESPTQAGTFLRYGTPPQDEQWIRAAVVGFDASAAINGSAWSVPTTQPLGIGAGGGLLVAEWPEGGKVLLELSSKAPGSTFATGQYRHKFSILSNEFAIGAPFGLETGVTSGVGVGGYYALVEGFTLTHGVNIPGGSDKLAADEGVAVLDGRMRYAPASGNVLDQLDGDDPPVALGPGEAYRAILYANDQGDGTALVEFAKGLKDATGTPTAPTLPAGVAIVADHVVHYDAGGVSIIDPEDTLRGPWLDRFHADPDPGNGLALIVGPGADIGPGVRRFRGTPTTIEFAQNITAPPTAIWLGAAGDLVDSPTRPDSSARLLWDNITTDATDVLTWRDRRQFPKGELGCQSIRAGLDNPLTGTELALFSTPQDLHVLRVLAHLTRTGTPNAGSTIIDILLDADPALGYDPLKSIWPNAGTPLVWPDTATELDLSAYVELPEIPMGTRVGIWQVDLATGGLPSSVTVCLVGHHSG